MYQFWSDGTAAAHDYSTILVGLFGESTQGGGDPNELLRIARAIRAGNREDWTAAFAAAAERVRALAAEAEAAGRRVTASDARLRAFTYYRAAELILPHDDARKLPLYRTTLECFRRGLDLSAHPHEWVEIPWEGRRLAGTFFPPRSPGVRPPYPTAIFLSGADALPEQNFFRGVQWLTARGLACLIVNGPGQGGSIRLHGLTTIPDYERPMSAAVDYLCGRADVDARRIGLMGVSMAGYYVLRAAAFEPRLRAVLVWGAMYSVLDDLWRCYPPLRRQLVWITGAADADDAERRLAAFTLAGVLDRVTAPVLIVHGAQDEMVPLASAERAFAELPGPDKALRVYDEPEGGATHINIDLWAQVLPFMADWLAERLRG